MSSGDFIPTLQLPTGGTLIGSTDPPEQAAACISWADLRSQAAPLLASLSCHLRVLQLLRPLIEIIQEMPNPKPAALQEFAKAAAGLQPLLLASTPALLLPFIRDLLRIEIHSLQCFVANLRAAAASESENTLQAAIQVLLDSYIPIVGLIDLAVTVFQLAGVQIPSAPQLSGRTDSDSVGADMASVQQFISTLMTEVDALGG